MVIFGVSQPPPFPNHRHSQDQAHQLTLHKQNLFIWEIRMMSKLELQMGDSLDETTSGETHSEELNVIPFWFSPLWWVDPVGGEAGGEEGMREVALLLRPLL